MSLSIKNINNLKIGQNSQFKVILKLNTSTDGCTNFYEEEFWKLLKILMKKSVENTDSI